MKRNILIATMLLVGCLQTFGQSISFKDVPLQGNEQELKAILESKYPSDIQYQDKNGMMLKGMYLDYPVLYIIHFDESEEANIVDVKFKQCYEWETLEEHFNLIKEKLSNKYGDPVYEVYNFTDERIALTSFDYAVKDGCLYSAEFKSNQNGLFIREFIKGFSDRTASVVIRHNNGEWSKQNMESIMNDLVSNASDRSKDRSQSIRGAGGYGTFDLAGRSLGAGGLPVPVYNVEDEGRVVVTIVVNPDGRVISTSINKRTNTVNTQLRRAAEDAAKKARFNEVDAVNNQSGTITYYFKSK